MKLVPVCLLAAGWVVLNVPLGASVHGIVRGAGSLAAPVPIERAWTLSGTSLAINTPCAAQVHIMPGSNGGRIQVSGSSARPEELAALHVKSDPTGMVTISAASCPASTQVLFGGVPFKLNITVPAGTTISINENGDTDYTLGSIGGDLMIQSNGNGDISAGQMQNLNVALQNDGDAHISSVTGAITAALSGDGDLHIDTAHVARTALTLTSDGDVTIDNGNTGRLTAAMSGDGDVTLPDAASLQVADHGGGDVSAGHVNGDLDAVLNGSGDLHSNAVAGNATLVLNGSGDADVAHVGGTLRQTINGSGAVTIGQ